MWALPRGVACLLHYPGGQASLLGGRGEGRCLSLFAQHGSAMCYLSPAYVHFVFILNMQTEDSFPAGAGSPLTFNEPQPDRAWDVQMEEGQCGR